MGPPQGLAEDIPYAYVGKRYDASSGLVYFGKRFYDPSLGRWLTPDPLGAVDHSNLYQYVFNNPLRYYDPNGESLGGYLLGLGEILLGGTIMAGGFALEVVTVGGFTFGLGVTTSTGAALMGLGIATTSYHAQDIKVSNISWKNANSSGSNFDSIYKSGSMDPTLPTNPNDPNNKEKKTPGNLQKQIEQGKAPKSVDRADRGRGPYEKDHLHFKDESALNSDGTWKHGNRELTRQEIEWLQKNGWNPPS